MKLIEILKADFKPMSELTLEAFNGIEGEGYEAEHNDHFLIMDIQGSEARIEVYTKEELESCSQPKQVITMSACEI